MPALIKKTKYDNYFSLLVRERANSTCENPACGVHYPYPYQAKLDCAHVFSRKEGMTRWHSKNALCLCGPCHRENLSDDQVQKIAIKAFGIEKFNEVEKLSREFFREREHDISNLMKEFRQQLTMMKQARGMGCIERLEFLGYPE